MKRYLIFTGTIMNMGGAQMYISNKVKYMKSLGWNVEVFSGLQGRILLNNLQPYSSTVYTEMEWPPNYYNARKREQIINKIVTRINSAADDEVVIESSTGHMAAWAELVASRIKAKHFCFLLDERFDFDKAFVDFFRFKTKRHELALINKKSAQLLFGEATEDVSILAAACNNVIEDIRDERFEAVPYQDFDYVVCSLGRLNKGYIPTVIDGFRSFALAHPEKKMAYIFIGDQPEFFTPDMRVVIREKFENVNNATVFQMGYVYPIPENFFEHVNAGVASAGSSRVLWNRNIPTISMDAKDGQPIGILGYTTTNTLYHDQEEIKSLQELLSMILVDDWIQGKPYTPFMIKDYEEYLKEHLTFISKMPAKQEYYDVVSVRITDKKNRLRRDVISTLGLRNYKRLKGLLARRG